MENKDNTPKSGMHVIIDYFTCTFDLPILDEEDEKDIVNDKVEAFAEFLNISEYEVIKAKKDRYKYSYKLGTNIQFSLVGPRSQGIPTASIEFKGEGCREFEALNPNKTWRDFLYFMLVTNQGRPSRIDITIDDYDGKLCSFDWLKEKFDKGFYTTIFKNKEYQIYGSKSKGYTMEFGSRNGPKALCIYQKNLQMKSKHNKETNQEYWTRFEMRFYHNDATNVATDILNAFEGYYEGINKKGIDGFKELAMGLFIGLIDVKEDNQYDANHQYMAQTDPRWSEFTNNANKLQVSKMEKREGKWKRYYDYSANFLPLFNSVLLLLNNKSYYQFTTEILKMMLDGLEKFDKNKLKKLNLYLSENKIAPLDDEGFERFKNELYDEIYKERRLPF